MSVSTEWSQVDTSMQALAPHSSDDLFGTELLGDELMDIYNAAVAGGGDDTDDDLNDISLLGTAEVSVDVVKKEGTLDDGFGAFRPSTSFNNLSNVLLDENSDPSHLVGSTVDPAIDIPVAVPVAVSARVVSSASLSPGLVVSQPQPSLAGEPAMAEGTVYVTTPGGTKRKKNISATAGPSPKRKNSVGTGGSKPKKTASKGISNKKATKKKTGSSTLNFVKIQDTSSDSSCLSVAPATTVLAPAKPVTPTIVVNAPTVAIKQEPCVAAPSQNTDSVQHPPAPVVAQSGSVSAPVAAPAGTVLSNPPTEADFKSVAQAAVNNLIMNAGNSLPSSTPAIRVDTSTEHVKALTGSNWVAVCGGGTISTDSNNQSNNDKLNRARRSNLTPDERARQNRDRNREHARNTRLRKKAYVEELKATLSALVTQRDASELEKRHASQRELEQREVRFRVLEELLKLRGRNEANAARWAAILEDKFTLTMPIVNFRDTVHSNDPSRRNGCTSYEQVLTGVTEVMNDSNLFSNFLQSLGENGNTEPITLAYNCDRSNFFMDNCVAMMDWTATTHGGAGLRFELVLKGQIRAKFSPASNKLISVILSFDTGAIMSQLNLMAKAKKSSEADAAAAAAQVAANKADAILDSLKMPLFESSSALLTSDINIVLPSSGSSSTSSDDKAVISSDDE
eukprot:jgi/Psemu1/198460/e_gw1.219.41.1